MHLFVDPDSKPPSSGKRVRGMSYDSDEGGGGIENSPVVLELRSVQDILGLTYFPADDIIDTMGDYSFNGQITEDGFLEVMELVVVTSSAGAFMRVSFIG